jgi:hypothetical protein
LASLGYSIREIQKLWNREGTKHRNLDQSPQVRNLVSQLRAVQKTALAHTTIGRILRRYSYSFKHVSDNFSGNIGTQVYAAELRIGRGVKNNKERVRCVYH